MRSARLIVLFIIAMMSFFSCGDKVSVTGDTPSYFNMADYFASESGRLEKGNFRLEKTIEGKDTVEIKIIDTPDWKSELEPFSKATLGNNPAMLYLADTFFNDNAQRITYSARDSVTPLRSVTAYGNMENPDSILFIRKVSNMYYQSFDTMFYSPGRYLIRVKSAARVGKDTEFRLSGIILPPSIQP